MLRLGMQERGSSRAFSLGLVPPHEPFFAACWLIAAKRVLVARIIVAVHLSAERIAVHHSTATIAMAATNTISAMIAARIAIALLR